jgi:V/A-type H+-transporting ATPase subunit A
MVSCLGSQDRSGALTVVGAVSPAGGDLSDPVVQATLRVVKVFWSLQANLAYMRHFPAIGWLDSYSLYIRNLRGYYDETLGPGWVKMVTRSMALLQEEANLQEIARLVGAESLSPEDQLVLYTSRSLREDFLHQNAFHPVDTYASIEKQKAMLEVIMHTHDGMGRSLKAGVAPRDLFAFPLKEKVAGMRYLPEEHISAINELKDLITAELDSMVEKAAL